jgi:hypothetical protein
MKRDMDLIRKLAFFIEAADIRGLNSWEISLEGYDESQIAYHVSLMNDAKLIQCIDATDLGSQHQLFMIKRLSNKGHDFVDSARSDNIWNQVKTKVTQTTGSVSLEVLLVLLKNYSKNLLGISEG